MKRLSIIFPLAALLIIIAITSCERRDLWVEGSSKATIRLVVDWSLFDETPTGMTVVFYSKTAGVPTVKHITANVDSTTVNLLPGTYDVLLFNQIEEEYSNVEFLHMDTFLLSEAMLLPLLEQPAANSVLYGPRRAIANTQVYEHPEPMAEAVMRDLTISEDMVDEQNLVLYKDRNKQRVTEKVQVIHMQPHPVVWDCQIRVFITGIQNLYAVRGSIGGLAGGRWLGLDSPNQTGVYHSMDQTDWYITNRSRTETTETGYIVYTAFDTFGMQSLDSLADNDVQLNLQILLRDGESVLDYHYDVANQIEVHPDSMLLYLSIDVNGPDLPDVPDKTASGFDAEVKDWDTDEIEIDM